MPDRTDTPPPPPRDAIETADALRQGIDRGRGDKVNFQDPAAAPLGTDDEAAGFPPTTEQVRMAAAAELRPHIDPPDERRTIPKLVQHRYAPVLLAVAFGCAVLLVMLD
jgi:hypothetical protein